MGFEELETDPVGLPEFDRVEPQLSEYVKSLDGYRKNAFPELPTDLRKRIAHDWRACFEEWGYTTSEPAQAAH